MKRLFTLTLALLVFFLGMIFSIELCEAATELSLTDCGTVLDVFGNNNDRIYVLSDYNNSYKLTMLDTSFNTSEVTIDINVNKSAYSYFDNVFYLFTKETEIPYDNTYSTKIITFDCTNNLRRERVINEANPLLSGTFAVGTDNVYYMLYNYKVGIFVDFKHSHDIEFEFRPLNLTSSADGRTVFCAGSNAIAIIANGDTRQYDIAANKIFPMPDGYFASDSGKIYRFDGSTVTEIYGGFTGSHGAAVAAGCFFGDKDGSLIAIYNEKEINLGTLDGEAFMSNLGDNCCCIIQNGNNAEIRIITLDDVKNADISNEAPPEANDYIFDNSKATVTGIEPGTTAAALRSGIHGSTVTVYDSNGYIKTSGAVGTGASVKIDTERFSILIYGELSGEGNINSKDKKLIKDSLLGRQPLEGIYAEAADVTGDGVVDLKDLVALDGYMKGEYSINQKR